MVLRQELKGLQVLNMLVNSTALANLAARTSVELNNTYEGHPQAFLMKQIRYILKIQEQVDDDQVIFFVTHGNLTIAEIEESFESTIADPTDASEAGEATAKHARIVWDSIISDHAMRGEAIGAAEAELRTTQLDSGWIGVGGKKGMPFREDHGFSIFGYNLDSASALGANYKVEGLILVRGVYLDND